MAVQDFVHKQIVINLEKIETWFREQRKDLDLPVYSSFDIRDSGQKVSTVDANIYPAGFNNICPTDRENSSEIIKGYFHRHYGENAKRILLLTEEHTNNPYYWDNVGALLEMMTEAGLEVQIAVPRAKGGATYSMNSASRGPIEVHEAVVSDGIIKAAGFDPDVVISNNDFSEFYEEWGKEIKNPINPPRELGWYQRKKSTYFKHYNALSTEFANIAGIDPFLLTVETELFTEFNINDEKSRDLLAKRVDAMIARLREEYAKRGINEEPFVFVKNNAGTYGLGVMRVANGEEIRTLNNKKRTKMKAAKGGRDVEEVIIQEGVRSIVRADNVTAEPTIYMLGCQLLGGFLRSHADKDETESLNSPGAVYKRMCVSDLKVSVEGHPMENVYGWAAKLGVLAIGKESSEMGVKYLGYKRWHTCGANDV